MNTGSKKVYLDNREKTGYNVGRWLPITLCSGIEEVITSTTGNRVAVISCPRVRIPPTAPANANTLDAVGATPTASTLSGDFAPENFTGKTIDASKRLARFEPARNHISAGALFEYGKIQKGH